MYHTLRVTIPNIVTCTFEVNCTFCDLRELCLFFEHFEYVKHV